MTNPLITLRVGKSTVDTLDSTKSLSKINSAARKDDFRKGLFILILGFSMILSGCATPVPSIAPGPEITESNKRFYTHYYSITAPANQGWRLVSTLTGHYDAVEIEKHTPPDHYNMVFTTNRVAAEFMKSWSAKKLAADYREGERRDMFQQGVLTGMYQLKDERQWEEEIGGKKFYAASAIMVTEKMNVKQYLYLYFPREVNVNRFFIALYNEGHPTGKPLEASFKDQFLEALKTLKWNTWVN